MPTYEFRCKRCGAAFEVTETLKQHDEARPPCPKCASQDTEQIFTTFFPRTEKRT